MTLREQALAVPCPFHEECPAVGFTTWRAITWRCGCTLHVDSPGVKYELRRLREKVTP